MRKTVLKTPLALLIAVSVTACSDAMEPVANSANVGTAQFVKKDKDKTADFDGSWEGNLELINPPSWSWELDQDGVLVTGTTSPAPNNPGDITGLVDKKELTVHIEFVDSKFGLLAVHDGTVKMRGSGDTFKGKLVQTLVFNGATREFKTTMTRVNGQLVITSMQATSVDSEGNGVEWPWNLDGTPVR